jgi:hypothetical protein
MRWASATACLLLVLAAMPARADTVYRIRSDRWTAADERGYGEFLAALGDSGCRSVDACLISCASITPGSAACLFPMPPRSVRAAVPATSATAPAATG